MTDCANELPYIQTSTLLTHYGFELKYGSSHQLVERWMQVYSTYWVRLAVIEALYQGRYKSVSVEYILDMWSRMGHPAFRFNHDFERLVCDNLPKNAQSFAENNPKPIVVNPPLIHATPVKASATLTPLQDFFPDMVDRASSFEPNLSPEPNLSTGVDSSLGDVQQDDEKITDSDHSDVISEEPAESLASPPNVREKVANTTDAKLLSNWVSSKTIQRFIPHLDESELYSKLRSVVHQELAEKMGT